MMLATSTAANLPTTSGTAASAVPHGQWRDTSSAQTSEADDKLDFSAPSSPQPPSYRPMTGTNSMASIANAPNNSEGTLAYGGGGVRTLAVDGADDTLRIVFSLPNGGKRPLYKLEAPKAPDSGDFPIEVQGLLEDVDMYDLATQQHVYTIRADRDLKTFTVIPQAGFGTNIVLKPTKKFGGTYRVEFENLNGATWGWKGSIFRSMELYEKNRRGEKKNFAVYIRTSTGSHTLRIYPEMLPTSEPLEASATLCLAVTTLYPFLAMYRKILASDYTSERQIMQRSARAQPSAWDSRLLGSSKQHQHLRQPSSPSPSATNSPDSSAPPSQTASLAGDSQDYYYPSNRYRSPMSNGHGTDASASPTSPTHNIAGAVHDRTRSQSQPPRRGPTAWPSSPSNGETSTAEQPQQQQSGNRANASLRKGSSPSRWNLGAMFRKGSSSPAPPVPAVPASATQGYERAD